MEIVKCYLRVPEFTERADQLAYTILHTFMTQT